MSVFRFRDYFIPFRVLANRRLMARAPRWSVDRLEQWGRERRRRVVEHAARTVPHYQECFEHLGIDPAAAERPEVWEQIPRVTKDEIRSHPERFVSSEAGSHGGFWATTSGSTGMPMKILLDRNVNAAAFALFWRAWESGGYWRLGQRQAAMKATTHPSGWRYNRAIRTLEISATHVNAKHVRMFRDVIQRHRPKFIRGYPSSLYLFCRLLRDEGLELHIPMVISLAETLHDFQREEIEGFLGARIFNHYTHWERAASALECERGRLHAQEDYAHHEILDDEGKSVPDGTPGEITTTSLHNLGMPLIRYRTGDVGAWSTERCDCGQNFPVITRIMGRQADYVVKADGSLVAATFVNHFVKEFPNITYAQIAQTEPGELELRLVPTAEFKDPQDKHESVSVLRGAVGDDMKVDVRLCRVEDLERSPVGKIRVCFNRIPRDRLKGLEAEVVRREEPSED